jgi:hypothetical protein
MWLKNKYRVEVFEILDQYRLEFSVPCLDPGCGALLATAVVAVSRVAVAAVSSASGGCDKQLQ